MFFTINLLLLSIVLGQALATLTVKPIEKNTLEWETNNEKRIFILFLIPFSLCLFFVWRSISNFDIPWTNERRQEITLILISVFGYLFFFLIGIKAFIARARSN